MRKLIRKVLKIIPIVAIVTFLIIAIIYLKFGFCCAVADIIASLPSFFIAIPFGLIAILYKDKILGALLLIFLLVTNFNFTDNLYRGDISSLDLHLKICSYNTRFFFGHLKEQALYDLASENCDVYLFQEIWQSDLVYKDFLKWVNREIFPDYKLVNRAEYVVFIKKQARIDSVFVPNSEGFLSLDVNIASQNKVYKLTIVNTHIWNPISKRSVFSFGNIVNNASGEGYFIDPYTVRKNQVIDFKKYLLNKDLDNTVIAGDFNTTQAHVLVREKLFAPESKRDSLKRVSKIGVYYTFPVKMPFLLIDHVYVGNNIRVLNLSYKSLPYSDHKLVVFDVLVPQYKSVETANLYK